MSGPYETEREAADELTQAIAQAIHDRKLQAVVALIKRLALTDPARAQQVLDTIELGLQMAGGRDADALVGGGEAERDPVAIGRVAGEYVEEVVEAWMSLRRRAGAGKDGGR